jgi:hypothetical protein
MLRLNVGETVAGIDLGTLVGKTLLKILIMVST